MATKKIATRYLGVRYREHPTRKHGGNRPDKCFFIRYKLDGKDKEEAVGWSSEGVTAESAFKILSQVRDNIRSGEDPKSLAQMRFVNEEAEQSRIELETRQAQQLMTFNQFWESIYYPDLIATKSVGSIETETGIYNKWIAPALENLPVQNLAPAHVEKIISKARSACRSAATLRYIITVISQIWSKACLHSIASGESPCRKVKKPRQDNRRMRFLTPQEAQLLLEDLALHSKDMRDICMVSLYTGMRAGEIHSLTWGNINFDANTIEVIDTKNKTNRYAFLTHEIKDMLLARKNTQSATELVFPGRDGKKRRWVGSSFDRAVKRLGFNNTGKHITNANGEIKALQITDRRKKVVFHTLRHTFASWLVQKGVPLYTVAQLMGHSAIEMTMRYSHLAPDSLRSAAMLISNICSMSVPTPQPNVFRGQING